MREEREKQRQSQHHEQQHPTSEELAEDYLSIGNRRGEEELNSAGFPFLSEQLHRQHRCEEEQDDGHVAEERVHHVCTGTAVVASAEEQERE